MNKNKIVKETRYYYRNYNVTLCTFHFKLHSIGSDYQKSSKGEYRCRNAFSRHSYDSYTVIAFKILKFKRNTIYNF